MTAPRYRLIPEAIVEAGCDEISKLTEEAQTRRIDQAEYAVRIYEAMSGAAPQPEPLNETQTGVGEWCSFGHADEQCQKFLLWFEDPDQGWSLFDDEKEARALFARAEGGGWNCYLFGLLPRHKPEPPADLVEKAHKALTNWAMSREPKMLGHEIIAAFAQEHAAAEKARADKAEKALADEREACAKIADEFVAIAGDYATPIAAAIRAGKGGGDE